MLDLFPNHLINLLQLHDSLTLLHIKQVPLIMEFFAIYMNLSNEEILLLKQVDSYMI
jgi:HD-GYP domain-containing protein (c-di-GMP phosphodiesterase class II)